LGENYDNLHFQNYFQNIFSYAYSISKVIELIDSNIDYDYILHVRYDVCILEQEIILINSLNDKVYIDNVGSDHSPLFYGDFIYFSSYKNASFFKYFYTFLKNNVFNNNDYKEWVSNIIETKESSCKGRYYHGIYSNQMIYSYFITKNMIPYSDVVPIFNCKLQRNKYIL